MLEKLDLITSLDLIFDLFDTVLQKFWPQRLILWCSFFWIFNANIAFVLTPFCLLEQRKPPHWILIMLPGAMMLGLVVGLFFTPSPEPWFTLKKDYVWSQNIKEPPLTIQVAGAFESIHPFGRMLMMPMTCVAFILLLQMAVFLATGTHKMLELENRTALQYGINRVLATLVTLVYTTPPLTCIFTLIGGLISTNHKWLKVVWRSRFAVPVTFAWIVDIALKQDLRMIKFLDLP